ncbi:MULTISPECIES: hypothetical protein [Cyanophyceae]|nr:hypothetical protein [Trichocoleus sp. FACHB-69]MBD1931626.1 hypothetical protein [Trichocoleus sp. FACHB-69]
MSKVEICIDVSSLIPIKISWHDTAPLTSYPENQFCRAKKPEVFYLRGFS